MDPHLQEELARLTQLVSNIELMQAEAANSHDLLIAETEELNENMQSKFKNFRSVPVKTKHFSTQDKSQLRHALTEFELSEDEEQVDLEGIQLGDGKYEKISSFAQNVRKL